MNLKNLCQVKTSKIRRRQENIIYLGLDEEILDEKKKHEL